MSVEAIDRRDVYLSCLCQECGGREIPVTSCKWRYINRLPWPTARRIIHEFVSSEIAKPAPSNPSKEEDS
jgi:hypothetical protein